MTAVLPLVPVAGDAAPGEPYRRITVDRWAGACGAVISGVDLAAGLDDETVAEIRRAILDHQVVFFRDQDLDPAAAGRVHAAGSGRTARCRSSSRSPTTPR